MELGRVVRVIAVIGATMIVGYRSSAAADTGPEAPGLLFPQVNGATVSIGTTEGGSEILADGTGPFTPQDFYLTFDATLETPGFAIGIESPFRPGWHLLTVS